MIDKKNNIKMKKAFLFLAMAATLLASCDKDDNKPDNPEPDGVWVDLGLPSGTLWAKCNLGATAPEEYGDYFAWGETTTKEVYNWSTYRYCTAEGDSLLTLTKYNTSEAYGTVDSLTTLEAADDAATVILGGGARIPTSDEWKELRENTTLEWTTQNGVAGRLLTGPNGNTLFLPAAGGYSDSVLYSTGVIGYYWTATLSVNRSESARIFYFREEEIRLNVRTGRFSGISVRPVKANR